MYLYHVAVLRYHMARPLNVFITHDRSMLPYNMAIQRNHSTCPLEATMLQNHLTSPYHVTIIQRATPLGIYLASLNPVVTAICFSLKFCSKYRYTCIVKIPK